MAILLIGALLASTFQCIAACTAPTTDPPCHHDKQSAACSHELVLQVAQSRTILPAAMPAVLNGTLIAPVYSSAERREVFVERALPVERQPAPPLRI
jgi:hypothetical protein